MESQEYTQDDLLGKKYSDLLKISKECGVKTSRRLKTSKLIEAILKCQEEASLSQNAGAIAAALEASSHGEEELLTDIQFPESASSEEEGLNSNEEMPESEPPKELKIVAADSNIGRRNRQRKRTYEVEESVGGPTEGKKHQKTATFDVPPDAEQLSPAAPPVSEQQTEENSQQLNLLVQRVSGRGSKRSTPLAHSQTQDGASVPHLSQSPAVMEGGSSRCRSSRTQVTASPAFPSPWQTSPDSSSSTQPKRSRKSMAGTPTLQGSAQKLPLSNHKSSGMKPNLKCPKPVFTMGHGNSPAREESTSVKQKGSGIPRFMTYARKLKVPNFAKIHERAFERMEALDDYVDKKRKRNDTISSTTKNPQPAEQVFKPSVTTVKNLNFNFMSEGSPASRTPSSRGSERKRSKVFPVPAATVEKSLKRTSRAVVLNSSKLGNRSSSVLLSPKSVKKTANSARQGEQQRAAEESPKVRKSPRALAHQAIKSISKKTPRGTKASQKLSPSATKKASSRATQKSPSTMSSKKVSMVNGFNVSTTHLKENVIPGGESFSSPVPSKLPVTQKTATPASVRKRMTDYSKALANKNKTYIPYRGAVKPLADRNALRRMAERKPNVKSSKEIRENQRNLLKGVRLNKRFELQMAKRGVAM